MKSFPEIKEISFDVVEALPSGEERWFCIEVPRADSLDLLSSADSVSFVANDVEFSIGPIVDMTKDEDKTTTRYRFRGRVALTGVQVGAR